MNDTPTTVLLEVLLAPDRSIPERLASLRKLAPYLYEEPVLLALTGLLAKEESIEFRRALLTSLVDSDQPALRNHPAWLACLQQTAAFEAEGDIRRLALRGLLAIVTISSEIEPLLAELLIHEFDPRAQLLIAEGLARQPRLQDSTVAALAAFAPRAPEAAQLFLVTVLGRMSTTVAQRGLAGLLQPTALPEVRRQVLAYLATSASLERDVAQAIATQLASESDPDLWAQALVLLFNCKDLPADTLAQICGTLLQRPEAAPALVLLKNRLHAEPALVMRLQIAFPALPSSHARHVLLSTLAGAELPSLTALALEDRHAGVRERGIDLAAKTVNRFPAVLVPALTAALLAEPISVLRGRILDALLQRPSLEGGTQAALLARFSTETDPALRIRLAQFILDTAPSPENQTTLLNAYLSLLDDVTVSAATSARVIERLQAFAFSDSKELAQALARLLQSARTLDEVNRIFPLLRKATGDLQSLHRALQTVLYRFIDYYAQSPLSEIVALLYGNSTATDAALQAEIPRVVKLTGAVHLLKSADADTRKKSVHDEIHRLMMEGDFRRAEQTITGSFADGVLRKSDLLRLYFTTLAHPAFDSTQSTLLEIMKKAKVITPEIVERTLAFLRTYPAAGNAFNLASYLRELGSTLPDYVAKASAEISQANLSRHCLVGQKPYDSSSCSGTGWGDTAVHSLWHHYWNMPELVDEHAQLPEILRAILKTPLTPGVPVGHSLHIFALAQIRRSYRWSADDFKAVCTLLDHVYPPTPETRPFAEFSALLAAEKWPELYRSFEEKKQPVDPELTRMATELFFYQLRNWQTQGASNLEEVPRPMEGIDLDYLSRLTGANPNEPAELLFTYLYILHPAARPADKPIPRVNREFGHTYEIKQAPKPRFQKMERANELLGFLLSNPIPTTDVVFRSLWQSLLQVASATMQVMFTRTLAKFPESRRNEIIAFMQGPPPIPPA